MIILIIMQWTLTLSTSDLYYRHKFPYFCLQLYSTPRELIKEGQEIDYGCSVTAVVMILVSSIQSYPTVSARAPTTSLSPNYYEGEIELKQATLHAKIGCLVLAASFVAGLNVGPPPSC